jgi:hypothetical protein
VRLHTTIDLEAVMNLSSLLWNPESSGAMEVVNIAEAGLSAVQPEYSEEAALREMW